MIICSCNFLSESEIRKCILEADRPTVSLIFKMLNKQPDCATCVKTIKNLIEELAVVIPETNSEMPYILVQSVSPTKQEWIMTAGDVETLMDYINKNVKDISWIQNEQGEWIAGSYIIKQFEVNS